MKKKQLLGSGCAAVLVLLLIGIWNLWFSYQSRTNIQG